MPCKKSAAATDSKDHKHFNTASGNAVTAAAVASASYTTVNYRLAAANINITAALQAPDQKLFTQELKAFTPHLTINVQANIVRIIEILYSFKFRLTSANFGIIFHNSSLLKNAFENLLNAIKSHPKASRKKYPQYFTDLAQRYISLVFLKIDFLKTVFSTTGDYYFGLLLACNDEASFTNNYKNLLVLHKIVVGHHNFKLNAIFETQFLVNPKNIISMIKSYQKLEQNKAQCDAVTYILNWLKHEGLQNFYGVEIAFDIVARFPTYELECFTLQLKEGVAEYYPKGSAAAYFEQTLREIDSTIVRVNSQSVAAAGEPPKSNRL